MADPLFTREDLPAEGGPIRLSGPAGKGVYEEALLRDRPGFEEALMGLIGSFTGGRADERPSLAGILRGVTANTSLPLAALGGLAARRALPATATYPALGDLLRHRFEPGIGGPGTAPPPPARRYNYFRDVTVSNPELEPTIMEALSGRGGDITRRLQTTPPSPTFHTKRAVSGVRNALRGVASVLPAQAIVGGLGPQGAYQVARARGLEPESAGLLYPGGDPEAQASRTQSIDTYRRILPELSLETIVFDSEATDDMDMLNLIEAEIDRRRAEQ